MDSSGYTPLSIPSTHSNNPPVPPLPVHTSTGRPRRNYRLPARFQDVPPEPDTPLPAAEINATRRVLLIVRDNFTTAMNSFGFTRHYPHRPSYDPETIVPQEDLSYHPRLPIKCLTATGANLDHATVSQSSSGTSLSTIQLPHTPPTPWWPFLNQTTHRLMSWLNNSNPLNSEGEADQLVWEVLLAPDFKMEDLQGFSASRENHRLDRSDQEASPFNDQFCTVDIKIQVPSGDKNIPPRMFKVPGLCYRKLTSVIQAAFSEPIAQYFHLSPFKLFYTSPITGLEERAYSEVYNSDTFLHEHDLVQRIKLHAQDAGCKLERIIGALMFGSDMTHLAQFGTAKAWPLYLTWGNLSKYFRTQPNSGAMQQVAYIPSVSH